MKKLLYILAFSLISGSAVSQEFTLTPENFKNKDSKDYVVIEFAGKTQSELFKLAKLYINSNYKNLKGDGYNEVEPDQIVLNLSESAGIVRRLGIPVIGGDFKNRYELNFKDGKMMVKPQFSHIDLPNGMGGLAEKQAFNKKGDMNINKTYFSGINEKTNQFIKDLEKGMSANDNW